jgi:hypothetical protein
MRQLFADPKRPLLDQAVPKNLAPLALDEVGVYVAGRFENTGRDAGPALTPLLEFTRGHPQRSMMLAHYLWQRTPRGGTADEGTCRGLRLWGRSAHRALAARAASWGVRGMSVRCEGGS